MYSHFARDFLREAKKSGILYFFFRFFELFADVELKLREYVRPGWTFHAKGLWLQPRDALHPVLTFVGSSNFGERSKFRDLEANLVLVTENDELQKDLSRVYKSYIIPFLYLSCRNEMQFWSILSV